MKTTLDIRRGSEGPRHDPYSYEELILHRGDDEFKLHIGLTVWFKINGREVKIDYDNPDEAWESYTEISICDFERAYYRVHGPKNKCPYCGSRNLEWFSGYVGEDMESCGDCGKFLYCEPVTESMV